MQSGSRVAGNSVQQESRIRLSSLLQFKTIVEHEKESVINHHAGPSRVLLFAAWKNFRLSWKNSGNAMEKPRKFTGKSNL